MATLLEVIKTLDPNDATLWTSDGLPKLDKLSLALGSNVTRTEVNAVAFGLTKDNVATWVAPPSKEPAVEAEAPVNVETTNAELLNEIKVLSDSYSEKRAALLELQKELDVVATGIAAAHSKVVEESDPHLFNKSIQGMFASEDLARKEGILAYVNEIDRRNKPYSEVTTL
jgi:hypothetical protein